jgi:competence protein ComEC
MRSPRPPFAVLLGAAAVALLALAHTGEVRDRAEAALGAGMPQREAALARGFVLGQDGEIDPRTKEDFRRAGLSHLLAVSGQNVALLALLAMPLLAALGMPLRTRLVWVLALIAVYVPLAGAGPSILRAGVMGALSVLAMLAGRRASRLYALAVAALVTLAIDPTIGADIGWQLSFAAVLGILLLAAPLRTAIASRLGSAGPAGALADGAAMTIAATLATAPLIALHFEALSTATLLANLLALPAVAPAMWLGMLAAGLGQVPGAPVGALNAINAPLLAYVAQVAAWCGRPDWAYLEVRIGLGGLVASYAGIAASALLLPRLLRRISALLPLAGSLTALCLAWALLAPDGPAPARSNGLRVSFLDVGQGDAILLQPPGAPAVLVDAGPPGEGLADKLRNAGVERLGAVILTHDQSDHAGGVGEALDALPVDRLLFGAIGARTLAGAHAAGVPARRLARGDLLRAGPLSLEVLWPPVELLDGPLAAEDPNRLSLVLLARWRHFTMLLTGDAEAEAVPLDPGPVDVLKLAHHGSEDTGLADLLARTRPNLAVISVGADNPHGHPTPSTLATLAAHGVRTMRTDRDGTAVIDVGETKGGGEFLERADTQSERSERVRARDSPPPFTGTERRASPSEGRLSLP